MVVLIKPRKPLRVLSHPDHRQRMTAFDVVLGFIIGIADVASKTACIVR